MQMKRICVFCGSSFGNNPRIIESTRNLGLFLAQRGIEIVYGGANVGLMGILANSSLQAGGRVIGVMPQHLVDMEVAHGGLTDLHIVNSMAKRKAVMNELSDGFIALPGGFGTIDETFEMLTFTQLGIHKKAVGLVNIDAYYDHLIKFLHTMLEQGFLLPQHLELLLVSDDIPELIGQMENYRPAEISKLFRIKENQTDFDAQSVVS